MEWYYKEGTKVLGPVSAADLERLYVSGEIDRDTEVWSEIGRTWKSYSEAAATGFQEHPPAAAPVPPVEAPAAEAAEHLEPLPMPPAGGWETCSQCGRQFAADQVIHYQGMAVCGECKPVFLQRLQEGAPMVGGARFAGFWIRVAARMIDSVVLVLVNMVLYLPFILLQPDTSQGDLSPAWILLFCGTYLAQFAFGAGYEIIFLKKFGATPGKMLVRVRVAMVGGEGLTWGRAIGRYFANLLSGFTLGVGYVIAAFDDEKRALHDHMCHTRVFLVS